MKQYKELIQRILKEGEETPSGRDNMPSTINIFGHQSRYDLREGFPLLTLKKTSFKLVLTELLWFLRGESNIKFMVDNGCNIWNEDAYNYYKKITDDLIPLTYEEYVEELKKPNLSVNNVIGGTGMQYPILWRKLPTNYNYKKAIDQFFDLIQGLKENTYSRRHIISAWNIGTLEQMALPACHTMYQFNVSKDGWLDCQLYQRSGDTFLG